MSEMTSSKEIIETGLGTIGKVRIIKALAEESKLVTVYVLHKKTHLKRKDLKNNLDDLVRIGWVTQTRYASVVYALNRQNKYVSRLVEFFSDAGYIG